MLPSLMIEAIGSIAACLSTLCWVPQAVRAYRTRETKSISLTMQGMLTLGVVLWFIYGLALQSWPLMISNAISLVFIAAILGAKLRYG
jgi:MtN3 and saliva related transmembrane protein